MVNEFSNDISYKYRHNQKQLLGKILSGTLDEDVYIGNLRIDSNPQSQWRQNPIFNGGALANPHKLYLNITIGEVDNTTLCERLFMNSKNFTEIVLSVKYTGHHNALNQSFNALVRSSIDLEKLEIRTSKIKPNNFNYVCAGSSKLRTLIIRCNDNTIYFGGEGAISDLVDTFVIDSPYIPTMTGLSSIAKGAFAEGGSGGTIYIPKTLYDHLGDGSEYDYKSATNWSTIDSYGTITWAQIEGSEYELT